MGRKILLVFAALTLIVAGGALYLSLAGGKASAGGPALTVLVASGDLPPGTAGVELSSASINQIQVPAESVPENAVTNIADVANLKTIVPIFKGQVLIARQFAATSATGGLPIPPGTNAVSVELSDSARVAGFVQPGSKVVVYSGAKILLPTASVIATGARTATGSGASNVKVATTIVTFALTPQETTILVGADGGSLYLGLLPT